MSYAACSREDVIAAYQELKAKFAQRRQALWGAYVQATGDLDRREYEDCETECWSILTAGLSGLDAEERVADREYQRRLSYFDDQSGAVA